MELRKSHEYQIINGTSDYCEKELNRIIQTNIVTIQGYYVIDNNQVSILITKRSYSDMDED